MTLLHQQTLTIATPEDRARAKRAIEPMVSVASFMPTLRRNGLLDGFLRWVMYGMPPGGFLQAVLAGDLVEAALRADARNRHCLPSIVQDLVDEAPGDVWGSPEAFVRWCDPDFHDRIENPRVREILRNAKEPNGVPSDLVR